MKEINVDNGCVSYSMKVFNSKRYRKLPGDSVFIVPYRGDSGEQRVSVIHGGIAPYFLAGPKGLFKKHNLPDAVKTEVDYDRIFSRLSGREITFGNFSLDKRSENGIGFGSEYEALKDFKVVSDTDVQDQINGYLMLFNKTRGGNASSVVLVDGLSELPINLAFSLSGFLREYAENFILDHQETIGNFRDEIKDSKLYKKRFSPFTRDGIKRRWKGLKARSYIEGKDLANVGSVNRIAKEQGLSGMEIPDLSDKGPPSSSKVDPQFSNPSYPLA